jgi:hypothetical protein
MNDQQLKEVWMSETAFVPFNESELIAQVRRQAHAMDRRIQRRNWREYIAAALVIVYVAAVGWRTDGLVRLGCVVIVAALAGVCYFLKRFGSATPEPDPQLTLAEYRDAILNKFDRQIWLLKNAKFWYVLPLYVAMMLFYGVVALKVAAAGLYPRWFDFAFPVGATLFCGFVWWLNESYGVRKLRREREALRRRLERE